MAGTERKAAMAEVGYAWRGSLDSARIVRALMVEAGMACRRLARLGTESLADEEGIVGFGSPWPGSLGNVALAGTGLDGRHRIARAVAEDRHGRQGSGRTGGFDGIGPAGGE